MRLLFIVVLSVQFLYGCSTNPVTGKSQLSLVSEQQELAIGAKQYRPTQQSQGGRYVVDPEVNRYVSSVGQALANVSDRKLPYEFVVLNSDVPNAWALPGGKIAINRGLLVMLEDEAQLAAVLGHEIVHAAARHGATQQTQGQLLNIGALLVNTHPEAKGYSDLFGLGASAAMATYGRSQELESDKFGIEYMHRAGYNPEGAVEIQQLFLKLSEGRQQGGLSALFSSHPPSAERVQKNRQLASQLGATGKRNKARFTKAIRRLTRDKEAYKLHQQALVSASQSQWAQALSLSNKAIARQPKEASFWVTKARVEEKVGTPKQAMRAFGKAISLNPEYFAPYLYRGFAYLSENDLNSAEQDLMVSNKLLQTTPANFYLGEIALKKGDRSRAANYYNAASNGQGELAQAALARLSQLK